MGADSSDNARACESPPERAEFDAAPRELALLVYEQLRRQAGRLMSSERKGHTLSATALVHEAYVKLAKPRDRPWQSEAEFYAAAAQAMRQILIDHARGRARAKRRGGLRRVDLDNPSLAIGDTDQDDGAWSELLALDRALTRLEAMDARMGEVVRLRYFAGLTIKEVATSMALSETLVKNEWAAARAWLLREMEREVDAAGNHP